MSYVIGITVIGIAALGMAWMPSLAERVRVSYSVIYMLFGILVFSTLTMLPRPSPFLYPTETTHIAELAVIISIMGTGLKIDEPFSIKAWLVPFRLVLVTMLLSIAAIAFIAWYFLGMDVPSAILLGAVLAPTDPVLASDVQVGPPLEKSKDNVKFSLTAEAGMNDGTAFPFVWLAIALSLSATSTEHTLGLWAAKDLFYRIVVGITCGYLLGRFLAWLVFYIPEKKKFIAVNDGFVAVAATMVVYGLTELTQGYGFIAVFVTAVTLRNYELHHSFHKKLHSFTDQIERILVAITLLLFGGSLVSGMLKALSWELIIAGLAFVLLVRPLAGILGLIGTKLHLKEKWAISFFGIRGIGSFFYLAFALQQAEFKYKAELWALVSFIVFISIMIHGFTANPVMKRLDERFATDREENKNPGESQPGDIV